MRSTRLSRLWLLIFALSFLSVGAQAQPSVSPLLSYQAMNDLKRELGELTWEVTVKPLPENPSYSAEFVPPKYGQGVLLFHPRLRQVVLLVSLDLIDRQQTISAVASKGRTCTPVGIRMEPSLGLAYLSCKEKFPRTDAVELADDAMDMDKALVFSVDNPSSGIINIFHGFMDEHLEPPLEEFRYVQLGGQWSYPLFGADKKLVAFTLRRVRFDSPLSIAATCAQVKRSFLSKRREQEPETRLRTKLGRPFVY